MMPTFHDPLADAAEASEALAPRPTSAGSSTTPRHLHRVRGSRRWSPFASPNARPVRRRVGLRLTSRRCFCR